jgi:holo-[acyl-carrier protein] synthase
MGIIGHGIDLAEVNRIARLRAEHGERFLDRCFTAAEQAYCLAHTAVARGGDGGSAADVRFAGRFAVKEAILKVLGTGWRGQIAWTDMEITNTASGKPVVALSGECAKIAAGLGITRWHVSISHTDTHAMGSAIGEGEERPQGKCSSM